MVLHDLLLTTSRYGNADPSGSSDTRNNLSALSRGGAAAIRMYLPVLLHSYLAGATQQLFLGTSFRSSVEVASVDVSGAPLA